TARGAEAVFQLAHLSAVVCQRRADRRLGHHHRDVQQRRAGPTGRPGRPGLIALAEPGSSAAARFRMSKSWPMRMLAAANAVPPTGRPALLHMPCGRRWGAQATLRMALQILQNSSAVFIAS